MLSMTVACIKKALNSRLVKHTSPALENADWSSSRFSKTDFT